VPEKPIEVGFLLDKRDFKPIFAFFPVRMRRNALISTPGYKKELRFGISMPENLSKLPKLTKIEIQDGRQPPSWIN